MGHVIADHTQAASVQRSAAVGGWRSFGEFGQKQSADAFSYDPNLRMRNIKQPTSLFTRDWSGPSDGVLPMPFDITLVVNPSPLVFTLVLPSVAVNQQVNPSPLPFPVVLPSVTVQRGAISVAPDPLAFPVVLPAVAISQRVNPSPLAFPLVLPVVDVQRGAVTVSPSPLVFAVALPDVDTFFGGAATPDPLVFTLALPSVSVTHGAVTVSPSPLAFPLNLPSVDVQRGVVIVSPSPLVFPLSLPLVTVQRGAVTVSPSPLAFPLALPVVAVSNIYYLRPDALVLAVALPNVALILGPVSVSPSPLVFRLFLPRLRQWRGTRTAGAVLTKVLYSVVLTGAEDNTTDLLLSAQSIQATLRSTGQDVLSVYVPGAAVILPSVLARLQGQLIVWERQIYSDGAELVAEVIRTPITEQIRRDRGPTRDTLTLSGRTPVQALSGTARTVPSVLQLLSQAGSSSFRAPFESDIRPLDRVSFGGLTFTAGAVLVSLTSTGQTMELQERE